MSTGSVVLIALLAFVCGGMCGALLTARSRTGGVLAEPADPSGLIRGGLDQLNRRIGDLEQQRAAWQSQLHQQVDEVRHSTDSLRRETNALATALRRPQVRGQWGELHLRRTVEAAGMTQHCDFTEQVHLTSSDAAYRPDLIIHLAGGRDVVVDAKTPLDAYLDAIEADDQAEHEHHLQRLARSVRSHVDALSRKRYWALVEDSPELVVLFVPSEACLAAALETDAALIEYAAERNVVLAAPTTLIGLLRTIEHGWRAETLAQATREIKELGQELHQRLVTLGGHFDKLGRSLRSSVESYNAAIGSLESRVMVTARQFEDIGAARGTLLALKDIDIAPRTEQGA
ncbi:MAG: DNA recombination protein RmuC [Marmoricola sp.]